MKEFYSNGKLLLTGEYVVLDGALSLAVPTQFGQSLIIEAIDEPKLIWKSIDDKGYVWFEDEFLIEKIASGSINPYNGESKILINILNVAKQLNPEFLNTNNGFKVSTFLEFPRHWGMGSSSTLINNIANWAKIDAYKLLELTLGGSGYDIACAKYSSPITYQLQIDNRIINQVDFNPKFKDRIYFVYLNKKQNSREGIKQYNSNKDNSILAISEISDITSKIIGCETLQDFEHLIPVHERIISKIIKQKPIKELLFNDYKGVIKSLGAWGGDFVLVTGKKEAMEYFRLKGYPTINSYADMILK